MGSRYLDGPAPKPFHPNPALVEELTASLAARVADHEGQEPPAPSWFADFENLVEISGEDAGELYVEVMGRARRIFDARALRGDWLP